AAACNNSQQDKKPEANSLKEQADSLQKEVLDGHDAAMPKWMKIPDLQKEVKRMIDSIGKLPEKARIAASSHKAELEDLDKRLEEANTSMQDWMDKFGERFQELTNDTTRKNLEEKIKYFSEEKIKIGKIKEAVLGSVQKADSMLKSK